MRQWPKAAWPWDYLVSNVSMWLVPYRPHKTEKEPARKINLVIFNSRWESEELWGPQSTSRTELLKIWETLVKRIELSFCLECFQSLHPPHADRHAHTCTCTYTGAAVKCQWSHGFYFLLYLYNTFCFKPLVWQLLMVPLLLIEDKKLPVWELAQEGLWNEQKSEWNYIFIHIWLCCSSKLR